MTVLCCCSATVGIIQVVKSAHHRSSP